MLLSFKKYIKKVTEYSSLFIFEKTILRRPCNAIIKLFYDLTSTFLHASILLFQLQTYMTLFTNFKHAHIHPSWPALLQRFNYMEQISSQIGEIPHL